MSVNHQEAGRILSDETSEGKRMMVRCCSEKRTARAPCAHEANAQATTLIVGSSKIS